MKERRKYRNFLVSYNENRFIGWRTKEELKELLENENVDWFSVRGKGGRMRHFKLDEQQVTENTNKNFKSCFHSPPK